MFIDIVMIALFSAVVVACITAACRRYVKRASNLARAWIVKKLGGTLTTYQETQV